MGCTSSSAQEFDPSVGIVEEVEAEEERPKKKSKKGKPKTAKVPSTEGDNAKAVGVDTEEDKRIPDGNSKEVEEVLETSETKSAPEVRKRDKKKRKTPVEVTSQRFLFPLPKKRPSVMTEGEKTNPEKVPRTASTPSARGSCGRRRRS